MNQPLSRPTSTARADGTRGARNPSARPSYRPLGAPTFGQALTSATRQAQGVSQAVGQGSYPASGQVGNPAGSQGAARPVWDGLLRSNPMGLGAAAGVDRMALSGASGAADPTRLGSSSTTSPSMLAALPAAQRPTSLPGQVARTPGVVFQGAAAVRPREPQPPSKAQVEDFMRSIKGFDQTKASEYDSPAQARTWGYSTCSAASLTAVLRAAGRDVKISDVMREMPNGMTVALGLVSRPSLVNAANSFGAKAADDVRTYEGLRAATEAGQPVLVDLRSKKFPEGHFVVVTGVDEEGVRVADSSRYDLTRISKGEFTSIWSGKGIRVDGLAPTSASGAPAPKTA